MALVHVAEDEGLLGRVREEVNSKFGQQQLAQVDSKSISSNPLLSSIYAETLRLHVKSFTVVSSPLEDVNLGDFWLPKNSIGLVNSYASHMDNDFWNTKGGLHPLESFWAERFLTDPTDHSSGPVKSSLQDRLPTRLHKLNHEQSGNDAPYFSLKGLEGSWIPYGGE